MILHKKGVFALAGLLSMAVCGVAAQAATTLQYVVQGHFSGAATGVSSISTNGVGESNNRVNLTNGATIEFDKQTFTYNNILGDPLQYLNTAPKAVSFGVFTSSSANPLSGNFGTLNFSLDIFQIVPSLGTGTFVGTANGTVDFGTNNGSVFNLIFNAPLSFALGAPASTVYTVNQNQTISLAGVGSTAGIQGQISPTAVPTPAVAWAGMALIGAFAAKRRNTTIDA
jgi:hypothetical protein